MGSILAEVTPKTTLTKEKTLTLDGSIVHETDWVKVAHNEFSDDIPVISLAGFEEDFPGGRRGPMLDKMVEACQEWGMFQMVDHDLDVELIDRMTEYSKEFYALPKEEKLQYKMSPGTKGGFAFSTHMPGEAVANWRELMVFFTRPVQGRDYSRWPNKPMEWKATIEAYSDKMMDLSMKVFELLSEGMGLEKDALAKSLGELPNQHLVVNHYPKCPQSHKVNGIKRHTDPGSITLLQQDHVGGLQATKDGGQTWITVRPIKNAIVVNLGDHAYYMTNGKLKSADHRAIVNSEETRMSLAAFVLPAYDAKVYPLNLKEGENSVLEKPITYIEMNNMHKTKYLETARLKKLATEQNWTQQELDSKLSQLH